MANRQPFWSREGSKLRPQTGRKRFTLNIFYGCACIRVTLRRTCNLALERKIRKRDRWDGDKERDEGGVNPLRSRGSWSIHRSVPSAGEDGDFGKTVREGNMLHAGFETTQADSDK